ncbi:flagellar assembly protein FliW [Microcella daejeonensis]|uniref:flagellar assembly protein FliW n=1 Tax=Microcella daejeonensis TaxID=2994971 RepID=UPI00226FFCF4|nr:flagellar assembly protein FliW [Microcella daejeonensis]WAB83903.1 flagellar assembly protein FliW [Microcella daejeonensis]
MTMTAPASTAAALPERVALRFTSPLLGLPGATAYDLVVVPDGVGLFSLESGGTRLFLVDPVHYVDDYRPRLTAEQRAAIGIDTDADALLLVVVAPDVDGPTANLLAPIVIAGDGRASQVLLDDQEMPVRAPLRPSVSG